MSSFRSRPGGSAPGFGHNGNRAYRATNRDDFYDDRRSVSRSPDRRYSSPYRRRSPPHDISRSPPRGPAADSRYQSDYDNRNWDRRQPTTYDRDPYRRERNSPSPRRGRNSYRDRDHERYQSPDYDDTGGSRSPRSREERATSRGRPSKEIIMEGLAAHLNEDDIFAELKQHYHVEGLEDVRIIRDRQTKKSRHFGFLRFSSERDSEEFLDSNYPNIYLYGKYNDSSGSPDDAKVRIAYGRERKDASRGNDEGDWICKVCNINNYSSRLRCFRCQAFRAEMDTMVVAKAANVGDNDASPDNTPSQFLLLRGLEPSVSEELFAKGVGKLFKPSSNSVQSHQAMAKKGAKGAKVASTTGDANLGAKEGTLRRVLLVRDRKTNESWRFGFAEFASIEDAQAALTRCNSFDRFTIASKQVLVTYIHAGVFVPITDPSAIIEQFTISPLNNPNLKLAYWDDDAYVTELVVSRPEVSPAERKSSHLNSQAVQSEGFKSSRDVDKLKKRKAEPTNPTSAIKKAAPSHLQFWSNRHAELHGLDKKRSSQEDAEKTETTDEVPPTQSYADPNRHCCYLCSRQFTSATEVNQHERLSKLHQENLKDEEKVARAQAKLEKHGIHLQQTTMEYRDRAKERRRIYGVVNKKGEQVGNGPKAKPDSEEDEPAPVQSKGASLLSKMGYTAGQGLGASGEGITTAIQQDIYAAGVGLGAQGGKLGNALAEADRNTKGDYSGFAEKTREGARERYSRM